MNNLVSPLVHRELLVYSRRPWTYWIRLLTVFGSVLVLVGLAATGRNQVAQGNGYALFAALSVVLLLTVTVTGLRSTADCVSHERREGTLGLLFLTDLKLSSVLRAKLVSSSFQNGLALLGVLPVLGVCLLLGGVSGVLFLKASLAIVAGLWLSLTVGIHESCRNVDEHLPFSNGLRHLLGLNLLPFVSPASLLFSALFPRATLFGSGYYWITLILGTYVGYRLWRNSGLFLRENWQDSASEESVTKLVRERAEAAQFSPKASARISRCGDSDPAAWIIGRYGDSRQASVGAVCISFTCLALVIFVAGTLDSGSFKTHLVVMAIGRFIALLAMGKIAPQSFGNIAANGALEILQTTPLTITDLIAAARRLIWRQTIRGVIPMLLLDAAILSFMFLGRGDGEKQTTSFALTLLVHNGVFLSALFALARAGIWWGIRHRSLTKGAFRCIFGLVLVPLAVSAFFGNPTLVALGLVSFYALVGLHMTRKLNELAIEGGNRLVFI